jgi:hypothetical protein
MQNFMDNLGLVSKDFILGLAKYLTLDSVPGAVAAAIFAIACLIVFLMFMVTERQRRAVLTLTRLVTETGGEQEFAKSYASICARIEAWQGNGHHGRLADIWAEFRETVIEPGEGDSGVIQNSTRPDDFFNLYSLGFGLSSWRFWPGFFVSVGLLATFLGLVAALVQTGDILKNAGDGADPAMMTAALSQLLAVASAKFIMSLSGLFASIFVGVFIRFFSSRIDGPVAALSHAIERRVQFLSLADIAQRQLGETRELRSHLSKLNAELISAISKPLEDATKRGGDAAADMMVSVTEGISESLNKTISDAGNQMEKAAESMRDTTVGLDAVSRRIEVVVQELAKAAEALEKGATPLADAISGTAETARIIGDAGVNLVERAEVSLGHQTTALTSATEAIKVQIEAFESRAKAYDGDMETALKVYKTNLDAAMGEVQAFSGDVHGQYANALQRLRAVIEGARTFSPEPELEPEQVPEITPELDPAPTTASEDSGNQEISASRPIASE